MTGFAEILKAGRELVFAAVQEAQNRVNVVQATAKVFAISLANGLIGSAFGLIGIVVAGAFSLLRAGLVAALGSPSSSKSVNEADYNAGFADGRKGMVPAEAEQSTADTE